MIYESVFVPSFFGFGVEDGHVPTFCRPLYSTAAGSKIRLFVSMLMALVPFEVLEIPSRLNSTESPNQALYRALYIIAER